MSFRSVCVALSYNKCRSVSKRRNNRVKFTRFTNSSRFRSSKKKKNRIIYDKSIESFQCVASRYASTDYSPINNTTVIQKTNFLYRFFLDGYDSFKRRRKTKFV